MTMEGLGVGIFITHLIIFHSNRSFDLGLQRVVPLVVNPLIKMGGHRPL